MCDCAEEERRQGGSGGGRGSYGGGCEGFCSWTPYLIGLMAFGAGLFKLFEHYKENYAQSGCAPLNAQTPCPPPPACPAPPPCPPAPKCPDPSSYSAPSEYSKPKCSNKKSK